MSETHFIDPEDLSVNLKDLMFSAKYIRIIDPAHVLVADARGREYTCPTPLLGFPEWFEKTHGELLWVGRRLSIGGEGRARRFFYEEDPTDFFVATKTQDELLALAGSNDDRIRTAARNALVKQGGV